MGGSVITDKSTPLSFRHASVVALAGAVSKVADTEPIILVHGGGSFGHYYSVMHDMHTKPDRYGLEGFAVVRNSMVHLHHMVLDALMEGGVVPYSCPPSILVCSADAPRMHNDMIEENRVLEAGIISGSGVSPVTYGDAIWCGNRTSRIISGDELMVILARLLDVRLAVFATDVDGLYTNIKTGSLVSRVAAGDAEHVTSVSKGRADGGSDVTGGMARKLQAAVAISDMATDVLFVNGNKPDRIHDIIQGRYAGTFFEGAARVAT